MHMQFRRKINPFKWLRNEKGRRFSFFSCLTKRSLTRAGVDVLASIETDCTWTRMKYPLFLPAAWSPLNLLWAQKYWKIYLFLLISFWQISYDDFKIILRILLFLYHKWSKKSIPPRRSNFIWITKVSIIFLQHCGRSEVFLSIYKYNLCRCELGTLIFYRYCTKALSL